MIAAVLAAGTPPKPPSDWPGWLAIAAIILLVLGGLRKLFRS
jgi:hypothetical protein